MNFDSSDAVFALIFVCLVLMGAIESCEKVHIEQARASQCQCKCGACAVK